MHFSSRSLSSEVFSACTLHLTMVSFLVSNARVFAVALVSLLAREALNSMAAWAEKMWLSYAAHANTTRRCTKK